MDDHYVLNQDLSEPSSQAADLILAPDSFAPYSVTPQDVTAPSSNRVLSVDPHSGSCSDSSPLSSAKNSTDEYPSLTELAKAIDVVIDHSNKTLSSPNEPRSYKR